MRLALLVGCALFARQASICFPRRPQTPAPARLCVWAACLHVRQALGFFLTFESLRMGWQCDLTMPRLQLSLS